MFGFFRFCDQAELLLSFAKKLQPRTRWASTPFVVARRIEEIVEIFTQCRSGQSTGASTHVFLELFPLVAVAQHLFAAAARRAAGRRRGCRARVNIASRSRYGATRHGCHASIPHFFGEIHDTLLRYVIWG